MDACQAHALARRLMNTHGLDDWSVVLDNAKRRLGVCRERRKEIGLSRHFVELNNESAVTNTILHEIAHALAGNEAGHGPKWRKVAQQIGADPVRCTDATQIVTPSPKWIGRCELCGFAAERHRLAGSAKTAACPVCCDRHRNGRYDSAFQLKWTENVKGASVGD